MSLFGQSSGTNPGSGGSLFGGLSLNTTGGGVDAQGKRKSIFDASTSQSNMSQPQQSSNPFGGLGGGTSAAPPAGGLFSGLGQNTTTSSGSSLFGNNTTITSAPSGGGLFPSTTTTTAPSGAGLFGSAATNTAPSGGGLFGAAATTSAPSGGGLFGSNPTTTAPAAGGLFGNAQTASAPSGGGLFGSTTTTSVPSGTGLFGSTATTSAPPGGGIFGNATSTTANSNPTGGASLFGAGTSTNQNNATSTFGQAQSSQAAPTGDQQNAGLKQTRDGAYFNSLLERQKKKARLQAADGSFQRSQLPNLNMDLGDLARRAQELGGRGTGPEMADSRAHYLLAGSGVAPGRSLRDFRTDDDSGPEAPPAISDHAFETETYIRNLQAKGRDAVMRENMERVHREVDAYIEQTLGIDFEDQKQRIMKHFGLISDEDDLYGDGQTSTAGPGSTRGPGLTGTSQPTRSVFGRSALSKSIIGTAGSVNGTSSFFKNSAAPAKGSTLLRGQTVRDLRDKESQFVEQVELLNQARMPPRERAPYPIMEKFGEVEATAGGDSPSQLADAYRALREITKESSSSPVPERHFAAAYAHKTTPGTPENLREQILDGSRVHLEKVFFREVERLIAEDPRTAQVGGQPTVINKIRAYIRVRASRRDLAPDGAELQQIGDNGDYCWILIFYLLRSGFVKEAAQYVQQDTAFQSTDKRFVGYMSNYSNSPDRRLPKNLQSMIDGEYQQRARLAPKGSVDPYRMACYKIVGRCDTESRNLDGIGQGVEDWLWLQFALARDPPRDEESGQPFGLEQIQETVNEIGEKHFQRNQADASTGYGTYFLMQILSGMFEQAIDYLHTFNPVSAVHFAIALSYYGLLRTVSDFNTAGNELRKDPLHLIVLALTPESVPFYDRPSADQFRPSDRLPYRHLPHRSPCCSCGLSLSHLPQFRPHPSRSGSDPDPCLSRMSQRAVPRNTRIRHSSWRRTTE
jgi:nuclear pore complex protein Nup93